MGDVVHVVTRGSALNIDWLREHGKDIRLHGNRFIQVTLSDRSRVHVFGDLVPQAQNYPTPIHDHVAGFTSKILAGTLINTFYAVEAASAYEAAKERAERLHKATSYRVLTYYAMNAAQRREGEDTALEPLSDKVYVATPLLGKVLEAGADYGVSWGLFHATSYIGYAVTFVEKQPPHPGAVPRVLCPLGGKPDNRFERYAVAEYRLWDVVAETLKFAQNGGRP